MVVMVFIVPTPALDTEVDDEEEWGELDDVDEVETEVAELQTDAQENSVDEGGDEVDVVV